MEGDGRGLWMRGAKGGGVGGSGWGMAMGILGRAGSGGGGARNEAARRDWRGCCKGCVDREMMGVIGELA